MDYEGDPHLRLEHSLGGPITRLAGWLQMLRDNDVDLDAAIGPMTKASLELNDELIRLGDESLAYYRGGGSE